MDSQRANPCGALFFTLDGNFEKVFVIGSDAWIAQSRLGAAEAETASFRRSNWHFVDRQVDDPFQRVDSQLMRACAFEMSHKREARCKASRWCERHERRAAHPSFDNLLALRSAAGS